MARNGPPTMPAIRLLSGVKRTSSRRINSQLMALMKGMKPHEAPQYMISGYELERHEDG
jgi:hypothetical protein